MASIRIRSTLAALACLTLVAGCGLGGSLSLGRVGPAATIDDGSAPPPDQGEGALETDGGSIFDIFRPNRSEQTVNVNRYIWNASLEVLNFLPIQTVDPFTGVIVTGYGTPPGGGRAYRATVYISDPALDARSLNVAMQTRSGPVSESTQRAVEDAILARARQLRVADSRF